MKADIYANGAVTRLQGPLLFLNAPLMSASMKQLK